MKYFNKEKYILAMWNKNSVWFFSNFTKFKNNINNQQNPWNCFNVAESNENITGEKIWKIYVE